jgi:hypothetical protein
MLGVMTLPSAHMCCSATLEPAHVLLCWDVTCCPCVCIPVSLQPSLDVFVHSPTTYYVYIGTKPGARPAAAAATGEGCTAGAANAASSATSSTSAAS